MTNRHKSLLKSKTSGHLEIRKGTRHVSLLASPCNTTESVRGLDQGVRPRKIVSVSLGDTNICGH